MPLTSTGSPGSIPSPCTESRIAHLLAVAYALFGTVAIVLLATTMPPFQNPDELSHFLRAAHVADGRWVGQRFSRREADGTMAIGAGGLSDPAIVAAYKPFGALPFHADTRVTRSALAIEVPWSGRREPADFANTAIYPPFLYLPAAAGVLVGRASRMPVGQTLILTRIATGLCALAAGVAAIAWAGGMAPPIFALLTLPMSFALTASPSQDASILGCAALVGSLFARAVREPDARNRWRLGGLTLVLSAIAMARPPYAALALLALAVPAVRARWRILAAVTIAGSAGLWSSYAAIHAMTDLGAAGGADPAAQIAFLMAHPFTVFDVARQTLDHYGWEYLEGFLGRLGWYDVPLPASYRDAALAMLGIAVLAAGSGARVRAGAAATGIVAIGISIAAMFGAFWVGWTPPGGMIVEGVQGRYFLPLALAGAGLLPALAGHWAARPRALLVAATLGFPVVTMAVTIRAIIMRYYLE